MMIHSSSSGQSPESRSIYQSGFQTSTSINTSKTEFLIFPPKTTLPTLCLELILSSYSGNTHTQTQKPHTGSNLGLLSFSLPTSKSIKSCHICLQSAVGAECLRGSPHLLPPPKSNSPSSPAWHSLPRRRRRRGNGQSKQQRGETGRWGTGQVPGSYIPLDQRVSGKERGELMLRWRREPECRKSERPL